MRAFTEYCVSAVFWRPKWWLNWQFHWSALRVRHRYGEMLGQPPVTLGDVFKMPAAPNVLVASQQRGSVEKIILYPLQR
jgi:hypothetical protein